MRDDGKVDMVTDLFGQAARDDLAVEANAGRAAAKKATTPTFAARVRFDNLVFVDAAQKVDNVTLAPLQPPHPGCAAFYRDAPSPDAVKNRDLPLRGYKVYRTTLESGENAPWHFKNQGVYGDNGELQRAQQRVNKSVQLLRPNLTGTVWAACVGLSKKELSALFALCAVDWRLGGGKPLGLGHCRVLKVEAINEDGVVVHTMERTATAIGQLPQDLSVDAGLIARMGMWQATQQPVRFLRYPRAVQENRRKKSRGGHVWFARHAAPKKLGDDSQPLGLESKQLADPLRSKLNGSYLAAQILPKFKQQAPGTDVLYGHDLFEYENSGQTKRALTTLEPFDPAKHGRTGDASGGFQGQNRATRGAGRKQGR